MDKLNTEEKKQSIKNSEILFLYDAKECNPNGDPDNENKPRMDLLKERILVSDVRLKRYIRDYFQNVENKPVFVSKVNDITVDATDRFAYFIAEIIFDEKNNLLKKEIKDEIEKQFNNNGKFKDKEFNLDNLKNFIKETKKWDIVNTEIFLKFFIDMRLFGVTLPIKDEKRGSSITFTGPVQFNWGYSLNKAELMESPSITSYFAGRTKGEGEEGGAIGKDWRIYYSLISFYGRISASLANKTHLTENDILSLDEAVWKSIITETNTRTKLNQHPRLYLRIEYNDNETFLGDLRRYIEINRKEGLRDVGEYQILIEKLIDKIEKNKDKISQIVIKTDEDIERKIQKLENFQKLIDDINKKKNGKLEKEDNNG